MTTNCPRCGERKPQRRCARQGATEICSRCCAETRDASCGDCQHYADAQRYRDGRSSPAPRSRIPDGHFIAELNPEVEQAVDAAMQLVEKGELDQARVRLIDLSYKHPRNHMVCYGMGTLHAVKEEHEQAIQWFDKATAIFPYFAEAHFNKAMAHQRRLDIGNAVRAYRNVVEVGDPSEPYVAKAKSFLADAAKTIRRVEGIDLDAYLESQTEFDRAFARMEQGEWLCAAEGFRASLAKSERHVPSHGNLGICLAKLGRKAEALAALDRALEIDPAYEPAMINRVAVERMEEGHPMEWTAFQSIEYSKERLLREQSRPRSLIDRFAARFKR